MLSAYEFISAQAMNVANQRINSLSITSSMVGGITTRPIIGGQTVILGVDALFQASALTGNFAGAGQFTISGSYRLNGVTESFSALAPAYLISSYVSGLSTIGVFSLTYLRYVTFSIVGPLSISNVVITNITATNFTTAGPTMVVTIPAERS